MENKNQSIVPFGTQAPSLYGGDPAIVAAAETAKARIQSAYIMAIQKPRNPDQARQKILRMCDNPEFAEKVEYSKPIGKTNIKDLSIRFAEAAMAEWGNILSEVQMVYDDDNVRRIRISVIDLETNTQFSRDVTLRKTIERKSKKGRDDDYIGERKNSYGQTVYILRATDDEMLIKESAMASKFIRTEGLRLLPAGIKQEAKERARATLASRDKSDPDAAKKRILDAFAGLNVWPNDIKKYLGHSVDTLSPSEIASLRTIYTAIDAGEASWQDYMQKKDNEGNDDDDKKKKSQGKTPSGGVAPSSSPSPKKEVATTPPEFAALVKAEAKKDFTFVATGADGTAHDNLSAYIEMVASNQEFDANPESMMLAVAEGGSFPGFWSGFLQGDWKQHFEGKLPEKVTQGKEPEIETTGGDENDSSSTTANPFDAVDWKKNHLKSTGVSTYFHTNKAEWDNASKESQIAFRDKWARIFKGTQPFPVAKENNNNNSAAAATNTEGVDSTANNDNDNDNNNNSSSEPGSPVNYPEKLREYHETDEANMLEACRRLNYDNIVMPMGKVAQKDLYEMYQKVVGG